MFLLVSFHVSLTNFIWMIMCITSPTDQHMSLVATWRPYLLSVDSITYQLTVCKCLWHINLRENCIEYRVLIWDNVNSSFQEALKVNSIGLSLGRCELQPTVITMHKVHRLNNHLDHINSFAGSHVRIYSSVMDILLYFKLWYEISLVACNLIMRPHYYEERFQLGLSEGSASQKNSFSLYIDQVHFLVMSYSLQLCFVPSFHITWLRCPISFSYKCIRWFPLYWTTLVFIKLEHQHHHPLLFW